MWPRRVAPRIALLSSNTNVRRTYCRDVGVPKLRVLLRERVAVRSLAPARLVLWRAGARTVRTGLRSSQALSLRASQPSPRPTRPRAHDGRAALAAPRGRLWHRRDVLHCGPHLLLHLHRRCVTHPQPPPPRCCRLTLASAARSVHVPEELQLQLVDCHACCVCRACARSESTGGSADAARSSSSRSTRCSRGS
jgi:hypothetical protein